MSSAPLIGSVLQQLAATVIGFSQHVAGVGVDLVSASEQQDFFFDRIGWPRRDSTNGRTWSGGSTPRAMAQLNFSSIVKQQQSPFQHCADVRHPHGRD
jgi:hypothetical protein